MNKQLLILSVEYDPCFERLCEAAAALDLFVRSYYLSELTEDVFGELDDWIDEKTCLLLRRPYFSNNLDVMFYAEMQLVLERYAFARVFDGELWQGNFMAMADKKYKRSLLRHLGLPIPASIAYSLDLGPMSYPVIVKKRLAGRCRANHVVRNAGEWAILADSIRLDQYVVEEFLEIEQDIRVLVLGESVIGAVQRRVRVKDDGRIGARVEAQIVLPDAILANCLAVAKAVGVDFVGVDLVRTMNGEYIFLEYNYSPGFLGFERETGIDVAQYVVAMAAGLE